MVEFNQWKDFIHIMMLKRCREEETIEGLRGRIIMVEE